MIAGPRPLLQNQGEGLQGRIGLFSAPKHMEELEEF